MATIPIFVLDRALWTQLKQASKTASLEIEETGVPAGRPEGVEHNWKCVDESGDLFFFTVCETNDRNALGVKAGTICLIAGPSARTREHKDVSTAWERFERALIAHGAQQLTKREK
jgi:hypothetical protein